MNKPVTQLELMSAAADAKPPSSSLDPKLIADLTTAGVDADLVGRVANATTAAAEPYDWSADNPDLLIPCQPETHVYWNPYDQVVIRQEAAGYGDDDPYVRISRASIPVLIAKLKQMLSAE